MDSSCVTPHLVAYHLGTVSDAERDEVEKRLVTCRACLEAYLALKRAADRAMRAAESERPRPEVKARLREAVAREFSPQQRKPKVAVLARRIPLYQGVALAAIAAAVALAAPSVIELVTRPEVAAAPAIDTSRTRAESLHIY